MRYDTIAAISTPAAKGGIGIVRMSGEKSKEIAERIFKGKRELESHTVKYGFIFDPKTGRVVDEVLVTYMKAPKTYTREDIIEINCHSGIAVLNKIMTLLIESGARQAERGEFTKRAFLNGRIDLTQAEAVIDIINAKTEPGRQSASNQLSGKLFESINSFMDGILSCLASIEAEIDYPEHFEDGEQQFFLRERIDKLLKDSEKLYETSERGRLIKEGVNTVIIGETNVGKSSLLNYFAGCDRAIVTDIHGTTRDTLEESVNINGVLLRLTDTAGIRETSDPVERIGVERAREAAQAADLILRVFDASQTGSGRQESRNEKEYQESAKVLAVINKCDLPVRIDKKSLAEEYGEGNVLEVSAKTGAGIDKLESRITELFFGGELEYGDVLISNMRHKTALYRCIESLRKCIESIENGFPEDIVSVDLMDAYRFLGEITGESLDENLADKIFSEFCLGK